MDVHFFTLSIIQSGLESGRNNQELLPVVGKFHVIDLMKVRGPSFAPT